MIDIQEAKNMLTALRFSHGGDTLFPSWSFLYEHFVFNISSGVTDKSSISLSVSLPAVYLLFDSNFILSDNNSELVVCFPVLAISPLPYLGLK